MTYTVGLLARLAKVSVRTLHHYDEIGLLRPTGRSQAGYRLYGEGDLERLQQVLFYRALDFGLDEIQKILDAPDFDRRIALISQRELLIEKAERARALVLLVDRSLSALDEKENAMSAEQMFEGFDPTKYADEVVTKWGALGEMYVQDARFSLHYDSRRIGLAAYIADAIRANADRS